MNRKTLMVSGLLVCLLGLGLLSISYASNISNPFIIIKGVLRLEINDTQIEKISDNPLILIGKQSTDIINYMSNLGYIFETQEGSGYFFNKDNETIILTSEQFTKKYITWRLNN
ncbi:hypothetical protein [Intestinibacter bartlettii]|uniref:Lipoprotein SmpA/OmlA domain-containing protein n=1 Tax=Intestinibacter bartlettii TaxID=261299 RepID=A0ABS6E0J6_9FIRM|nr:hypothetical protein [Intestinibacter bartlettii]MBU5337564.1 hypothetical protein [Intestinibacter bartlettii]